MTARDMDRDRGILPPSVADADAQVLDDTGNGRRFTGALGAASTKVRRHRAPWRFGVVAVGALFPLLFDDVTVFRIGVVLIMMIAAFGLHILVNWTGELSFAHAGTVGVAAFLVAKLSAEQHVSPIVLLPLGMVVGAAAGAVIGLPALRAKGLHVALVTLAAAIAIDRLLFTKEWLVGPPGGYVVPASEFGPVEFRSSHSLYPILLLVMAVAYGAVRMLHRSKLGRGFLWIKADEAAARSFGVPARQYKLWAYVIAGSLAGLSGAMSVVWVQRVTPQSFLLARSFTYLVIVVLAGQGLFGGVAVATAMLEGGRVFVSGAGAVIAYSGPIAVIVALTRYREGLNGLGRALASASRQRIAGLRGRTERHR